MANSIPVQWLISGSRDNNGNINDSGRVYFFEAGTTTNKTIWADAPKVATYTQTTDVGGPHNGKTYVPLSADGKPTNGEVYADGVYDEYVYDSGSNLIDTISSSEYSIPGTVAETVTTVTASTYLVLDTDQLVLCDTSANSITLTMLSAASSLDGQKFTFIKTTSDANTVTLNFNGADTVNGQTSAILTGQYDILRIQSDGSNFIRLYRPSTKGSDIASAATLVVPHSGYFDVTGAIGISKINAIGVGSIVHLHFDSTPTLTSSADLLLPGGQNITVVANDEMTFIEYVDEDWRLISEARTPTGSGTPVQAATPTLTNPTLTNPTLTSVDEITLDGAAWPSFSVYTSAAQQNITDLDQVEFDTELFDTNSDFDTGTFRFTPTVAGKYLLSVAIRWENLVGGDDIVSHIYKNGVSLHRGRDVVSVDTGHTDVTAIVDANGSTDYFEIFAQNFNRDTSDLFGAATIDTFWTGCRIG